MPVNGRCIVSWLLSLFANLSCSVFLSSMSEAFPHDEVSVFERFEDVLGKLENPNNLLRVPTLNKTASKLRLSTDRVQSFFKLIQLKTAGVN